jgi:hypothetical protein
MKIGVRDTMGSTWPVAVVAVTLSVATMTVLSGQQQGFFDPQGMFTHGQNIAPSFDGWQEKPDGTIDLIFGYMNRNWEEQPDVPIGPNNNIEPGGPDLGQPTHFFPRRNRHVFRVGVPKDFGKKEIVWTLVVHGKTEKAYATLKNEYALDQTTITANELSRVPAGAAENRAPIVTLEGDKYRTVKVGQPLSLSAFVSDDGIFKPTPAPPFFPGAEPGFNPAMGLRVAWFVYRGAGQVTFAPEQFKVYMDVKGNSPWAPGWTQPPLQGDRKSVV